MVKLYNAANDWDVLVVKFYFVSLALLLIVIEVHIYVECYAMYKVTVLVGKVLVYSDVILQLSIDLPNILIIDACFRHIKLKIYELLITMSKNELVQ